MTKKNKQIIITIGTIILLIIIGLLSGILPKNESIVKVIKMGNKAFISEAYQEAYDIYNSSPKEEQNHILTNNLGLTEIKLEKYEEALLHLNATDDNYILRGNANYYLGKNNQNPKEMIKYYDKALLEYKQGIMAKPEDIELKFNYEFVKNEMDQLKEQEQQQENQEQKDGNENQENNNQSGEQDSNEEEQSQNQEQKESQEAEHNEAENQQNSENQEKAEEEPQDESEIAQILYLLEQQEADSLKNNQEIKKSEGDEQNDW